MKQIPLKQRPLNRWRFFVGHNFVAYEYPPGWRAFEISVIKLISYPPQGCYPRRSDYKGFRLVVAYWLPVIIRRGY